MSSVRRETVQASRAVVFRLTARDRSSAVSHPRRLRSSWPPTWPGATALALAAQHSIHRTAVLAPLERHRVSRRGRVLTPDHIERAVSLYSSGRSCASIGKELQVNPETVRQALLKAGVAMAQGRASIGHKRVLSHLDWRYRDDITGSTPLPALLPAATISETRARLPTAGHYLPPQGVAPDHPTTRGWSR